MNKLEQIREKCVEANPEIAERAWYCSHHTQNDEWWKCENRPNCRVEIRLADVLLVIENVEMSETKRKDLMGEFVWGHWTLSQNTLEAQSKETIDFISSLLK